MVLLLVLVQCISGCKPAEKKTARQTPDVETSVPSRTVVLTAKTNSSIQKRHSDYILHVGPGDEGSQPLEPIKLTREADDTLVRAGVLPPLENAKTNDGKVQQPPEPYPR